MMPDLIHKKMAAIMSELGPIAKADRNAQQKYAYRSAVRVFNAVHPVMVKHGVTMRSGIVSHEVRERVWQDRHGNEQLLVRAIAVISWWFVAEDGSSTSTTLAVEGVDYQGDKATNKCLTVSQRQAVCQTFMIPTSDAIDSEDSRHDTSKPEPPKGGTGNAVISDAQRKRLFAMSKDSDLSKEQMESMLKGYGYESSKDILKKDYDAICKEVEAEGRPRDRQAEAKESYNSNKQE